MQNRYYYKINRCYCKSYDNLFYGKVKKKMLYNKIDLKIFYIVINIFSTCVELQLKNSE